MLPNATPTTPVAGVLCIDIATKLSEFGQEYKSYIAASYVKFVESAGASVVPIWIGRDEHYYRQIMKQINGILIPGGAVLFDKVDPKYPNKCVESSQLIYKIAIEMNLSGCYFPLWGTCLGFELLLYHSAGGVAEIRQDCTPFKESMAVEFEDDFRISKMFGNISSDLVVSMRNELVAYHFHKYCITKQNLMKFKIADFWLVTAVNKDQNGLQFISTIEHRKYPFYGVQFHPERPAFECKPDDTVSHCEAAIASSRYFANFFVAECKRNDNHFESISEGQHHLIRNFPATVTEDKSQFAQCYLFQEDVEYPAEQLPISE